jgi:hypothetical protein
MTTVHVDRMVGIVRTQRPMPSLIIGCLMCNSIIIVHVRTTFMQVDELFFGNNKVHLLLSGVAYH